MKSCKLCSQPESAVKFAGRSAVCNACRWHKVKTNPDQLQASHKNRKVWRQTNKAKKALYDSVYHQKNKLTMSSKFRSAKCQAKKRHHAWDITLEQFTKLNQELCHYCKGAFGNPKDSSGSGLDRIDNAKGYSLNNVLPACSICNYIRGSELDPEQAALAIMAALAVEELKQRT